MVKHKKKHHRSVGGKVQSSSIYNLSTANFSDDSDSDSSDEQVVMLLWNSGKVCLLITVLSGDH